MRLSIFRTDPFQAFVLLVLLTGSSAFAQNQLNLVARCLSFQLQPFSRSDVIYGTRTTYFTTYDGRDDIPPLNTSNNGLYYYSGEMRPLGGGNYAVDYISYSSISGYIEDGYFTASLPTTDADGNDVPDFLQLENSVSFSFPVTQTRVRPSRASGNATFTFNRSAGQVLGTYSGPGGSGTWSIAHIGGTGTYTRGAQNPLNLSLASASFTGVVTTSTGNTTSTVNSPNQVTLAPFVITSSAGLVTSGNTVALTRSGKIYRGSVAIVDGLSSTAWADFTQWIMEATDNNDSNGNGVPDWSDTPNAPVLKLGYTTNSQTITITGQPSHKYTTYYSTDLKNWQLVANLNIVTGTNKVSFNHATTDGSGFYRATFP
jgi:hypothetical protein